MTRRVWLLAILIVWGMAPMLPAAAAEPIGSVPQAEYGVRRRALAAALREEVNPGETAVLLLRSLPEPENATFRQDSNLYYLTGTEIPGTALILVFDRPAAAGEGSPGAAAPRYAEFFYLPDRDPRQEQWSGPRPFAGGLDPQTLRPDADRREAMRLTGFDEVPEGDFPPRSWPKGPIERSADLPDHLALFLSGAGTLFLPGDPGVLGQPLSEVLAFRNEVRARYPEIKLKDPRPALAHLRMVKSPAEIALLRRAVEITCLALRDASRAARPGAAERQVQAELERRFLLEGARRPGYPSIVASGPNSCILHYDASERVLQGGDLLLMDAGAEFRRYTADVTRTIPVGGRFSDEQRKIYDLVLRAQEAAIAVVKPGVAFSEVDRAARQVIAEGGYGDRFPHGTSHFLGLDVHDAGDRAAILRAGMVFTIEPGVYLPGKGLGIRIEDDILVTEAGAEILSRCLPRAADAVEMQMRNGLNPETR